MLTLINSNRMRPLIAPIGLDYVAGSARAAGIETDVLDLALADTPDAEMASYFEDHDPSLVGITFRNVDDCFWPSAQSFLPDLKAAVARLRTLTDAPIVLGGVGFSIFARQIVEDSGADFGIHGDGEQAIVSLHREVELGGHFDRVPGLIWRNGSSFRCNPPAWPKSVPLPAPRDAIDNAAYFRLGGQGGFETRRGCGRGCLYCADPVAKGASSRLRDVSEIADEVESLLAQGVDVLHTCDAEFNIPIGHARAICDEFIRRGLGERVRWYAYLAVVPFDAGLARSMRRAGCVGINFTGDSASETMLATYRQPHRREHLAEAVRLCRENGMAVMIDLLLGGPGESRETLAETIGFMKQIGPDCVGAGLGVRLYPGTQMVDAVRAEGPMESNPAIRRKYDGPVEVLRPTFYISSLLGDRPAALVREIINGDQRFFPPALEATGGAAEGDHNYNDNTSLEDAIAAGARGAYWDILRQQT